MVRSKWIVLLCGLVIGLSISVVHGQDRSVSEARWERLQRGVNLPDWLWLEPDDLDFAQAGSFYSDDDLGRLRASGITWIRLPLEMNDFWQNSQLHQQNLDILDEIIRRTNAQDLAIMIDIHVLPGWENGVNTNLLENDSAFAQEFITFWQAYAGHLAATDPEMVFLEPLNEPIFDGRAEDWYAYQGELLAAIREAAPDHTLIATSSLWSSREMMIEMQPYDDPNLVYNFHNYDPFVFTHQNAGWITWEPLKRLKDVPYPSSPEAVQPLIDWYASDGDAVYILQQYGEEGWNKARIEAELASLAEWAAQHQVRVIMNEFGVYVPPAPVVSQWQWVEDTRSVAESYGFAWAMWGGWDFWTRQAGFGFVWRDDQNRMIFDLNIVAALGLDVKSAAQS